MDRLFVGQALQINDFMQSSSGEYKLIMQSDGNLVLYKRNFGAVWQARTVGQGATHAVMQPDGNFVLYRANNSAVWSTQTDGRLRPRSFLVVQDDGNVVVFDVVQTPDGKEKVVPLYDTFRHDQFVMTQGSSHFIEYIWTDGVARYASLTNVDVYRSEPFFPFTDDPDWLVIDPGGGVRQVPWIAYLTADGSPWLSTVHCSYKNPPAVPGNLGPYIYGWFIHKRIDGSEGHTDDIMIFLDGKRRPWKIAIDHLYHPWDRPPYFIVSPLNR